jgi:hypothetical protein
MLQIGLTEDDNSEVQPSQISARSIENQGKELDNRVSKTEEKQRPPTSMTMGGPVTLEIDLGSNKSSSQQSVEVVVTSPQVRKHSEEKDFETEGRKSSDQRRMSQPSNAYRLSSGSGEPNHEVMTANFDNLS